MKLEKVDAIARVVFAISLSTWIVLVSLVVWQELASGLR